MGQRYNPKMWSKNIQSLDYEYKPEQERPKVWKSKLGQNQPAIQMAWYMRDTEHILYDIIILNIVYL